MATGPAPDPSGERILVTGGCGFIGANLAPVLREAGYRVRVLDDLSAGRAEYLAGQEVELLQGDICDPEALARAVAGCAGVVHLAAETSVVDSVVDPEPTYRVNVGGTLALLRASVDAGVRRFVFASSNAVLGEQPPPIDEMQVPRPVSPYGASKLAGEAYCAAFWGSYGLGTVALRFANAYGPYCAHKSSVVPKFLRCLLAGQPLQIYGDGRQTRDFIFAADIARAILLALRSEVAGEVFQIATGRETSVLDLVEALRCVTGKEPALEWLPQPTGEIRRNYASIAKAERTLGFTPMVGLPDGLIATLRWLKDSAR